MDLKQLNILLADDDTDDCLFFKKALEELQLSTHLITVRDGEQLMNFLSENSEHLPDVLFLDLSMPRKNGFECLSEIKENKKLKDLPVVMFSTSFPQDRNYEKNMINILLKMGAHHYIRKSGDFAQLKQIIHNTLIMEVGGKKLLEQWKNS
jgi:CheY-like chemotaxis protein